MTEPTEQPTVRRIIPFEFDPTVVLTDFRGHPEWVDRRPKWRRALSKVRRLRVRIYLD